MINLKESCVERRRDVTEVVVYEINIFATSDVAWRGGGKMIQISGQMYPSIHSKSTHLEKRLYISPYRIEKCVVPNFMLSGQLRDYMLCETKEYFFLPLSLL